MKNQENYLNRNILKNFQIYLKINNYNGYEDQEIKNK